MSLSSHSTVSSICDVKPQELKEFRKRLNLSQKELAEKLKVATNTVSRWEIGARQIPEFLDLALETVERKLKSNN
jgi:DNA-binding transcriptional regulator YiaG